MHERGARLPDPPGDELPVGGEVRRRSDAALGHPLGERLSSICYGDSHSGSVHYRARKRALDRSNRTRPNRGVMHNVLLVVGAFLASAVEMVEALTIVLAVGVTRGWRSAGWGVAAAVGGLAVIVAGLGPSLANLPIGSLLPGVGTVLLGVWLRWCR